MVICPKCGSEVKDGVKFCGKCGAPVKTADVTPAEKDTANAAARYQYKNNYQEPEEYSIRRLLKRFGGSPLFLIYIVVSLVVLVLTFISGVSGNVFGILALVIVYLPSILCLIGMILGFADARSNEVPVGNGVGLYKAGKILEIVFAAIIGVVSVLLLVFSGLLKYGPVDEINGVLNRISETTGMDYIGSLTQLSDTGEIATIVIIIMIILIGAVITLSILYDACLIGSASAVRKSLESGKRTGYISMYPVVILIIGAVCAVLGILGSLFAVSSLPVIVEELSDQIGRAAMSNAVIEFTQGSLIALILLILIAAKCVIGAVLLINLKTKIREA